MGKIKSKKKSERRQNPTGLENVLEINDDSSVNGQQNTNFPVCIEKLSSASAEERECSCVTIASLVFEPGSVAALMKHNLVRRLAPLLIDKNKSVQEAAAGALRNLSLIGGNTVCQKMVEEDVMTPLIVFTRQTLCNLQGLNECVTERNRITQHAVQAINLLWNLCECSGVALTILNRENILPVLMSCLHADVFPMDVVLAAAHCLHTCSEDNDCLVKSPTQQANVMSTLDKVLMLEAKSNKVILLKVLAAGILYNIQCHVTQDSKEQILSTISSVFSQALAIDAVDYLNNMISSVPSNNGACNFSPGKIKDKSKAEEALAIMNAQQICLEVLSNMCCMEDESEDEWEDVEETDSNSDEECQENCGDFEMASADATISQDIISSIVSNGLPKMVLNKCTLIDSKILNVLNVEEEGRKYSKGLQTIQNRSLVCLNNMLSNIPVDILGGPEALASLWDPLFNLTFISQGSNEFSSSDEEFMEATASSIRSLMEKLAEFNLMQHVKLEQAILLCQMGQEVVFEPVKVHLLNTIGIIGKMAAKESNSLEVLKTIGAVLKNVATSTSCSLWIVAEALDAMFDTFADGPVVDSAACSIGLLNELQILVPILKNRIKKERQNIGEHWPVVQAAKTNLIRFIKYKTSCT